MDQRPDGVFLTLFAVLAPLAVLRGWLLASCLLAFAALLSKKEAVFLPLPRLLMMAMRSAGRRNIILCATGFAIGEPVYVSSALTPGR